MSVLLIEIQIFLPASLKLQLFFSEVILTLGHSRTVKKFLYAAKEKKRSFQVYVAEGAPKFVHNLKLFCCLLIHLPLLLLEFCHLLGCFLRHLGHVLAKELAEKRLQTTVISDSSVFAIISRVNMVIVDFAYSVPFYLIDMQNLAALI